MVMALKFCFVNMNISQIKLYDLFRKKLHLPDKEAADFVLAVGNVVGFETDNKKQLLATKEDINYIKGNIVGVREDIVRIREDLKKDIHHLEIKVEQSKGDLYKAMFWTSIVQLITILGGVLAIVKFML